MKKAAKIFLIYGGVLGALFVACAFVLSLPILGMYLPGLLAAGEWENDPENWRRAFGEDQPAEVRVVRSKYWRSAHFTYEFAYFFEATTDPSWTAGFCRKHGLKQVPPDEVLDHQSCVLFEVAPGWFVAGSKGACDMWEGSENNVLVWIRKADGRMFLGDMQL